MLWQPALGLFGTTLAGFVARALLRRAKCERRVGGTILDVHTVADARALVELVSTPRTDVDCLLGSLTRLFRTFAPSERTMRSLSLAHTHLAGTGGCDEFVVCTVYSAGTLALSEGPMMRRAVSHPSSLHRAASWPRSRGEHSHGVRR